MLTRFELPPTVHPHAHRRVWQRGGYDKNIWREKKRQEKLTHMYKNPVRRGLASQPGDGPGWRMYEGGGGWRILQGVVGVTSTYCGAVSQGFIAGSQFVIFRLIPLAVALHGRDARATSTQTLRKSVWA